MFDTSFFAWLFLVATSLAPADATTVTLENTAHPEQRMIWTRADDGRWAMTINGRDMGHFVRESEVVVHHTGTRAPDRFPIAELVQPSDLRRNATRIRLAGTRAPTVIHVEPDGGARRLVDPSRETLRVPLRLR